MDRLPTLVFLDFPGSSAGKESAEIRCGRFDPWGGKIHGEGTSYSLQFSGLENSRDCIVHGVAKSQTRLSDSDFHFSL